MQRGEDNPVPRKGRGALSNRPGRFESLEHEAFDDGWGSLAEPIPKLRTEVQAEHSRTVISYNQSPDIPFDRSINPYRGCEHGCVYCYARPTHAWLGLSPGLDFESRLFFKEDAAKRLRTEIGKRGYRCRTIALGANTDPYQPIERKLRVTRSLLEVLSEAQHPVGVVTKSALVERDLDLLAPMAQRRLCSVALSITTLSNQLARKMEPRAAAPHRRLETVARLSAAGIPVSVLVAPVIPFINDSEIESILSAAREAGARAASYVMLRLPREIEALFTEWVHAHFPDRAERVLARIRDLHAGKAYRSEFGIRQTGTGVFAELIAQRFSQAKRRLGFPGIPELDCRRFEPPDPSPQLRLL